MSLRRDPLGIPIVDARELEELAERFLTRLAPHTMQQPIFAPLAEMMEQLKVAGLCTFSFNESLGQTDEGYKYLGYYDVKRRHIAIDATLTDEDVRFPFTVAHELGHFYLHSKVDVAAISKNSGTEIRDSSRELVTYRVEGANPRTLLEWQANKFAAAILVPRRTLRQAVETIQRSFGVTRRLGHIWLDRQPSSRRDYQRIVLELAATYRVSNAVLRYRLSDLGILEVDYKTMPSRVGDVLGDSLLELFEERARIV